MPPFENNNNAYHYAYEKMNWTDALNFCQRIDNDTFSLPRQPVPKTSVERQTVVWTAKSYTMSPWILFYGNKLYI